MKLKKEKYDLIMKCDFIYKHIWKDLYLCRMYGSKKIHPLGYHIIFPMILSLEKD